MAYLDSIAIAHPTSTIYGSDNQIGPGWTPARAVAGPDGTITIR